MSTQTQQTAHAFATALASSLTKSLTDAAKETVELKVVEAPEPSTSHPQLVHFRFAAEGKLRGESFMELTEAQVAHLGSKILGTPSESFSDAHADAFQKTLSSAMTSFGSQLHAEHGEVSFKVERALNPSFDKMQLMRLAVSGGDKVDIPAALYLDRQMIDSLAGSNPKSPSTPASNPFDASNLSLVMDVELNVSLRFGQRQLPLREVLDLTSGSVIELDCQVDEPIDLLLDGKVIARGEAVIVDGNYGLRVTEIPQPMASHFSR